MDWDAATKDHHDTLTRIVAGLFVMVGLISNVRVDRLAIDTYRKALRMLRPTESALRRLIIYAAREIMVELPPAKEKPLAKKKDKANTQEKAKQAPRAPTGNPPAFPLSDPRKRKGHGFRKKKKRPEPRVWVIDDYPGIPAFLRGQAQPATPPKPAPEPDDGMVNIKRLLRRLWAIKAALEDLPGQAMRYARWEARNRSKDPPKFVSPLRGGPPPGYRSTSRQEVHRVLDECHQLAYSIVRDDDYW